MRAQELASTANSGVRTVRQHFDRETGGCGVGEVGRRRRSLFENLARRLESGHPGAAGSLREGLEETLTVMRLDLHESLERVLSSTNLIENLFSRVRDTARRSSAGRAA